MKIEDVIKKFQDIQKVYGNNIKVFNIVSGEQLKEIEFEIDGYIYIK